MKKLFTLYYWVESKLHRKYILGMASGLIAISLFFAVLFLNMYQTQLENELAKTSSHLNELLQTALENSMLKQDVGSIRNIINIFGKQDDIQNVMVLNPSGEVRMATEKSRIGEIKLELANTTKHNTTFINTIDDGEVLRSINPVFNKDECSECHGSKEKHIINGIILVDFNASVLRKHARNTTLVLMGAGSTVVLITLFGGWWFMGFFVLRPVHKLLNAQQRYTNGQMDARAKLRGNDEISQLGNSFDSMTETIEAQLNKLEKSTDFLQSLIEGIPDSVRVIDQNFNLLLANQAYINHAGCSREEALSSKCYAIHHRDEPCVPTLELCPLFEINVNGQSIKTIHHHLNAQGEESSVEIFAASVATDDNWGKPPIIIEIIRDLSQSVNYSQEQRLTAIGMLASGVAHEIHNPLASIQIAFHSIDALIESNEPVIDQLKKYIALVEGEIDKCVDITGKLLKLGNLPEVHLQPIYINTVISETISLLQWEADSKNITMRVCLPEISPRVLATDNELRMVILNLIQNAYHAMPNGGELAVTIKTINSFVILTVEDTGVGVSKENQERIFDPFFTSRSDKEKGSGLGLSITKAIIKRFNGDIRIFSDLNKGATFTITLPDADNTALDRLDNELEQ